MDNTFFPFPSGCNLVFCRYTVKKIIDDIKIEKEKKMKGSYEIWVMTVIKKTATFMKQSVMIMC